MATLYSKKKEELEKEIEALRRNQPKEIDTTMYESDREKYGGMVTGYEANKPAPYQFKYQDQQQAILDSIMNREKFNYDINGDALFQQYKNMYTQQGQRAMLDTIGQASTLTGGYGNTYAQSAGQQVYQDYMQRLNDKIPELYQLALNQYNQEGEDMYNKYGLYRDIEQADYGKYRDAVADYDKDVARAESNYWRNDDAIRNAQNYNASVYNNALDIARGERDYETSLLKDERDYNETVRNNNANLAIKQASATAGKKSNSVLSKYYEKLIELAEDGNEKGASALFSTMIADGLDKETAMELYDELFGDLVGDDDVSGYNSGKKPQNDIDNERMAIAKGESGLTMADIYKKRKAKK